MRMLLVLSLALGCGQKRVSLSSLKSLKGPVEIVWNNEYEFQVKDQAAMKGRVILDKSLFKVSLENFPQGMAMELGSATGIVGSYGGSVALDISEKLGALPVDVSESKLDPGVPLVLKPADQPPVTIKLQPQRVSFHIDDLLKKAENGPLLFGKEAAHDGPPRSIMVVNYNHRTFGAAATLADVDALAFEHLLSPAKGSKVCGGYTSGGKKMPDVSLQLKETEVSIIDRRSGKLLQKKVFVPDASCPMFVMTRSDENQVDSSPPATAIEEWLRGLTR
jgi:hypothetical protein